ncbi:MAG: hypothetical protein AAGG69_14665 [Pseudomonadota bacterium]
MKRPPVQKLLGRFRSLFDYRIRKHERSVFAENDIAFLHIGKNAGTQIKQCADQLKHHGVRIRKFGHNLTLEQVPDHIEYFFSVRDPISRFRSGFYSRKRKGAPRIYSEWTAHERIAFEKFEDANELAEALFRPDEKGFDAAMAIKSIFHTSMQQIDWFHRSAFITHRPPLWIIRQEHLEADLDMFLRKLGLSLRATDLLSSDPVKAHSNDYGQSPELSSLARKNLQRWYCQDVQFYQLCERWIRTHS